MPPDENIVKDVAAVSTKVDMVLIQLGEIRTIYATNERVNALEQRLNGAARWVPTLIAAGSLFVSYLAYIHNH